MAIPPPVPVVDVLAGAVVCAVGLAFAAGSRQRVGRLLALYLGMNGAFMVLLPLRGTLADPAAAQALVNVMFLVYAFTYVPVVLLAAEFLGPRGAAFRAPPGLALALALPAGMVLLELLEPVAFYALRPDRTLATAAWEPVWRLDMLLLGLALVALVGALTRALVRERDPAAVPVLALLLAAFLIPAVNNARGFLTSPGRYGWLRLAGLEPPAALLPPELPVFVVASVFLAALPLPFLLRAPAPRTREVGASAVLLAMMVSGLVGLTAAADAPFVDSVRFVFAALLVAYAGIRHGLLGTRRVSPALELPLAAAGFGALLVLFVGTLGTYLDDAAAVTGGFVLALVAGALALAVSGSPAPVAEGDRYREERVLGRGAQGTVVLALDRRLHRPVVVKRPALGEVALREARAAARAAHPSLVAVHDVIRDARGPAVVMEYMPGGTLEQRLARGPLGPEEARRLGQDLAGGLGALHAAGVVHGDVKAGNVFFRADGRAALGDFGVARRAPGVEETAEGLGPLPPAGSLAGVAPEVLRGEAPDARADVYGLGALLYRCLAGEPYLRFPPTLEEARAAVLRAAPRLPHPAVPARWDAVLTRALAKDPARRFPSARDLGEALEGVEGAGA